MIKLMQEHTIKTHKYDENGNDTINVKMIEKYHYDSEEEKYSHLEHMESLGYEDSGQVKENIGTISNPIYVWFGSYVISTILTKEAVV